MEVKLERLAEGNRFAKERQMRTVGKAQKNYVACVPKKEDGSG